MAIPDLDIDEILEGERPLVGRAAVRVEDISEAIVAYERDWTVGAPIALGSVRWTPSLVSEKNKWVLHVHIAGTIRNFIVRRLTAAAESGYSVHVALYADALYESDILRLLANLDAYTYVVDDPLEADKRRHYLAAMADLDIPVTPALRKELGLIAWSKRADGTVNERGRRLEALLAFVLAQVGDFRVFSRNYRTETQEIDIVIQVIRINGRSWCIPGSPFILVESKNTADPMGQSVISLLIRKLQTKRGSAKLGFLFAAKGFTRDAITEELRLSETPFSVAMFDGSGIVDLIQAEPLDEHLEIQVSKARLR